MSLMHPISLTAKIKVAQSLFPGSALWLKFYPRLAVCCLTANSRGYQTCPTGPPILHLGMNRQGTEALKKLSTAITTTGCPWTSHVCRLATNPKSSIEEVKGKKGAEITVGKKVVQAGKDVTYLGVIIVGLGVTALMFFTVGKELFSSKSPNVVYTRAFKRCKNNDEVTSVFGLPLKGYGEMTRRRRRRHVSHYEYEVDGVLHMRVKFYIEGPDKKGTVNCEVKENESGDFEYRYLFVDVDGYPPQTIVLEDNR